MAFFLLDAQLHSWLGGFVRMHGLLQVQGGRANNRESITTEWEALNEDMAGLQLYIHTPAWNWRIRNHFGPRDDSSWREIAFQIFRSPTLEHQRQLRHDAHHRGIRPLWSG